MAIGNRHSQHSFAQIPSVNQARSSFDRSFAMKTTFNFDTLVPIFVDEIVPGDTCNVSVNMFARLTTQIVPLMDNAYIDFFFFFIPNRLVWQNWEKFCGAQDNPGDSTDYVVPQITTLTAANGSIYDQMGIPTATPSPLSVNAMPLRAYNLVWNEWFRDQNLLNSLDVPVDDGPDSPADYVLQNTCKKQDYFTSCLPWPQKGPAVTLPLGTTAPVITNSTVPNMQVNGSSLSLQGTGGSNQLQFGANVGGSGTFSATWGNNTGLQADLNNATAATINALRQAFQVQSILELDARGGTRFTEILLNHYGVVSPDARLQRPEYLGGGMTKISSHPVAQSSATASGTPQANLASFGTASASGSTIGFSKSFVEHGYVLGLMRARGDITYQQGLNKLWTRSTRFDFFWPKLQELGEQAVLNEEIYATGTSTDSEVFGYQERYAEYRYKPSEIHGEFRSNFAQPLDFWHLGEEFGSLPALNGTFIQNATPIARNIAVEDAPNMIADFFFRYTHARPMLTYSVPVTLGRF